MNIKIGSIELKNPFMPASGTFGYGLEYAGFGDLSRLGAIVTKGVSLKPRPGNRPPRICEVSGGMLNSIGLENVGFDEFRTYIKELKKIDTAVIVNFFGNSFDEYVELAELLNNEEGISALEMNISCPNIKEGGICFGTDENSVYSLVKEVRVVIEKPLWVKLTPNTADIASIALAAERGGADALVIANTYLGMAIDIVSKKPKLSNIFGGFSGPSVKPLTMYNVFRCVKTVSVPVIACGGIMSFEDAIEYLIVGAKAVQVGTANFTNPSILWEMIDAFKGYLIKERISVTDLIGSLKV